MAKVNRIYIKNHSNGSESIDLELIAGIRSDPRTLETVVNTIHGHELRFGWISSYELSAAWADYINTKEKKNA
jgi:hypothetical protein